MLGGESHLFLSFPTRLGMGLSVVETAGEKPFPLALLSNLALPHLLSLFPAHTPVKKLLLFTKPVAPRGY